MSIRSKGGSSKAAKPRPAESKVRGDAIDIERLSEWNAAIQQLTDGDPRSMAKFIKEWGITTEDERKAVASYLDGSFSKRDARSSEVKLKRFRDAVSALETYQRATGRVFKRREIFDILDSEFGYAAGTAERLIKRHSLMEGDANKK